MSGTPETAPMEQNPSSEHISPGSQQLTTTAEQNASEQTNEPIPIVQTDSNNPQVVDSNKQIESNGPSSVQTDTLTESKVNKTDIESEKQKVEEPKGVPENDTAKPKIEETTNDVIKSNNENGTVKTDAAEKTEIAKEVENSPLQKEDPPTANENKEASENKEPESENGQDEGTDTSDGINIQELTEHVMNILNDDGMVENAMSEQQLMKKNIDLQQFIVKLIHLLKEKTDLCANLDRQNSALISQAKSLKDVIAITKDLLGIRNMEIEHLHADMAAMEDSIKEERNRHNLSVQRLNEAMTLNDKLKTEYLTQMDLFQKLREKYNEKVVYLTRENQRLNGLMNPDGQPAEANTNEVNDQSNQIESVDK